MKNTLRSLLFFISLVSQADSYTEEEYESMRSIGNTLLSLMLIAVDDLPDAEVVEFMSDHKNIQENDNGFIFLWGFNVVSDSPYNAGLSIFNQLKISDANYKIESEPYDFSFLDEHKYFKVLDKSFYCQFRDLACFNEVFSNNELSTEVLNHDQVLLERYHQLYQFEVYHSEPHKTHETPLAPYNQLAHGHFLNAVKITRALKEGEELQFLTKFILDTQRIKQKLIQESSLLGVMIFNSLLQKNLDLLSIMIQKGFLNGSEQQLLAALKPLTDRELSVKNVIANEHHTGLKFLKLMGDHPEYFLKEQKKPITMVLYHIFAKVVLKTNVTINNHYYYAIKPMLSINFTDPKKFLEDYEGLNITYNFDYIRNYIGSTLNTYAKNFKRTYLVYQGRMHSSNMKIQLIRAYIEQGSFEKIIDKAKQGHKPYLNHYDNSIPYIKDQQICYTGIFEANQKYRCLNIVEAS